RPDSVRYLSLVIYRSSCALAPRASSRGGRRDPAHIARRRAPSAHRGWSPIRALPDASSRANARCGSARRSRRPFAEFLLAAAVEAEPQAKAVGQRHLFLDGFARIDRGRALVLHHVARHEVAPVRRGIEYDVVRPPLDAAFEHGLERFVAGVFGFEGEVVAEHDETVGRPA